VNDEETYPAHLENVLNASHRIGPPFQVINAAWTGTTSYFGAVTLVEYLDRFRPTVVVIGWGGVNDSMRVHFRETRVRHFSPLLRALRSSAVYRLGESSLFRLWFYPELVSRVSDDEYRAHLRAMHNLLRQRGVGAVFLTESLNPERNWSHIDLLSPYDVARKARIMVEEGRALGDPVVDVVPLVNRGTGGYVDDGVHWTPAGNRRIAEAVAQAVLRAFAARNASTGPSGEPGS
jgi:lysophospholipase L1-like esterase